MKKFQIAIVALAFAAFQVDVALEISSININIYTPATDTGRNMFLGSLIDSFSPPDIHFGLDMGNDLCWNPVPGVTDHDNGVTWGADITGFLTADTAGTYDITLLSDDGSYVFMSVKGAPNMVINNGGDHGAQGPTVVIFLNVGNNPFELQYGENGVGGSGVWLTPQVPEPTTMLAGALLLLPFGASALRRLRKNRAA